MFRLGDIRIQPKLILFFVLTGIIPLCIAGFFGNRMAVNALMEKSFNQRIHSPLSLPGVQTAHRRPKTLHGLCRQPTAIPFGLRGIGLASRRPGSLHRLVGRSTQTQSSAGCQQRQISDPALGEVPQPGVPYFIHRRKTPSRRLATTIWLSSGVIGNLCPQRPFQGYLLSCGKLDPCRPDHWPW